MAPSTPRRREPLRHASVRGGVVVLLSWVVMMAVPTRAAVLLDSVWNTATGNSDTAILDGTKWTNLSDGTGGLCGRLSTVIAGGGPSGLNSLRITTCPGDFSALRTIDFVPQSTDYWFRFYWKQDTSLQSGGTHLMETSTDGACDTAGAYMKPWADADHAWMNAFAGSGHSYPYNYWHLDSTSLAADTWYRFEFWVHFVTPTTYQIWPRIYNLSNTLLYDATTHYCNDCSVTPGGSGSLTNFYSLGNVFSGAPVTCLNEIIVGYNDPSGGILPTGEFFSLAAFQIRDDTWPGPHVGGDSTAPAQVQNLRILQP